jgi:hyaluronoglucosaminidase
MPINGGIPQRGNLSLHLTRVEHDVEYLLPDPDFDGYAVIDWEVWMPWLVLASRSVWVNESIAYVRELHPSWSEPQIEAEAVRTWNVSATLFMVETLKRCVTLRPKAAWGYYGRPGCYSGLDTAANPPQCTDSVQERNDALEELWAAGSALYPSVYIKTSQKVCTSTTSPNVTATTTTTSTCPCLQETQLIFVVEAGMCCAK